jgi:hypothetical protein
MDKMIVLGDLGCSCYTKIHKAKGKKGVKGERKSFFEIGSCKLFAPYGCEARSS